MLKTNKIISNAGNLLFNLRRLLKISWQTDKFLTSGYYTSAGVSAFFPIIASYIYKLFIDNVINSQGKGVSIPVVVVVILGARYLSSLCWDFVSWVLKETYFDYLLRYKLQNKLNNLFCERLATIDIQHLEDDKTQDLITKTKDTLTWRVPDFLRAFSYLFNNLVAFVAAFVLLLGYGWYLPLIISLLGIPQLYLRARLGSLQWSIWGSGAPDVRKLWYLQWLLTQRNSIVESRIFRSGQTFMKKYKDIQQTLYERNKSPIKSFVKTAPLPRFVEMMVVFLFALNRLPLVLSGEMSLGSYTFFIELLSRLADTVAGMVGNLGWMYENNLYTNHFFEIINLPKLITERKIPIRISEVPYPPEIEFKNVSFSYPGSKKRVLNDISFKINSKENVALVGNNGAGKTTIVKLICRFYDISEGEILINNINIKDISLDAWYKNLGTLFQDFVHYDFTVRENISLSSSGLVDETKLYNAAEKSGALEFINKLPNKFDQQLGKQFEDGTDLSQGQWQKIAIARAFYESAPILILDEPTSAIDAEGEYKIFNNLHTLYVNKSLFFISHRFSTVKEADNILVLDNGRIIEQGAHKELINLKGKYARLFELQAKAYQEEKN